MAKPSQGAARSGPPPTLTAAIIHDPEVEKTIQNADCEGAGNSLRVQSVRLANSTRDGTPYKCSNPTCKEDVSKLWSRECGMCGLTYCYACTTDVRKLSSTGQPDPLGKEKRVCVSCTNLSWEDGQFTDLKDRFYAYRKARPKVTPPPDPEKPLKVEEHRGSAVAEAERLTRGYQVNYSRVKGLMADFVVPSWQKTEAWQPDSTARECEACKGPLKAKKLGQKAKVHCRLCGKIFCADCTKSEILLYITGEGVAKWAINGREGGPATTPAYFELLSMCDPCCRELEAAILAEIMEVVEDVVSSRTSDFSERLKAMQKQLSMLLHRVEELLPAYRKLVDCFMKTDQCNDNPFHQLAKTQSDLNSALSTLITETKKLQTLHPSSRLQDKLLRNISASFTLFYVDNVYLYRQYQDMLSSIIPNDALQGIQSMVCRVSMGDVLRELNVTMYHGLGLSHKHHFSDTIFTPIVRAMLVCEEELEAMDPAFFESHSRAIREGLRDEAVNSPMFSILMQKRVGNTGMAAAMFCHIAATRLREAMKMLVEKSVEEECRGTKEAMKAAVIEVERLEDAYRQRLTTSHVSKPDPGVSKPDPGVSKPDLGVSKPDLGVSKPDHYVGIPRSNTSASKSSLGISKPDLGVSSPVPKPGSNIQKPESCNPIPELKGSKLPAGASVSSKSP